MIRNRTTIVLGAFGAAGPLGARPCVLGWSGSRAGNAKAPAPI